MRSSDSTNPCSDRPEESAEPRAETSQETRSGDAAEHETPSNPVQPREQLPAVITIVRYLVFSIPCGFPPKVLRAYNDQDVCRLIGDLLMQNDQQYLFVVRNGELGKLFRSKKGLGIRFKEAGKQLRIRLSERFGPISENWVGD